MRGQVGFGLRALLGGGGGTRCCDFLEPSGGYGGFRRLALFALCALCGVNRLNGIAGSLFGCGDFRGGSNVGGLPAPADRLAECGLWCWNGGRFGRGHRGSATTPACGYGWCRLLLGTLALFALPTGANAGDLVVRQRT